MHGSNTVHSDYEQLPDAVLLISLIFVRQESFVRTVFWYSYEYLCLHVDVLSAMDSGMHKVKLNKATFLVWEKSTKFVQNALEVLQGNGEEHHVPHMSSYMLWIASAQGAVKLSSVCTTQKVKFLFVNWMQND